MNYPLISEYIEAIGSAEDNFNKLSNLRPVLDDNGNPIMSSGNFAVVFKMKDVNDGRYYAVKCFLKEQEGRNERYQEIAEELAISQLLMSAFTKRCCKFALASCIRDRTRIPNNAKKGYLNTPYLYCITII